MTTILADIRRYFPRGEVCLSRGHRLRNSKRTYSRAIPRLKKALRGRSENDVSLQSEMVQPGTA